MKLPVLFTIDKEHMKQGIDHLLANGIWVRVLTQKAKRSALIYSLDRPILVDFADVFGLTNFRDGHTVKAEELVVYPCCIEVWGRKLESIECWKRELSGDNQSPAAIPQS